MKRISKILIIFLLLISSRAFFYIYFEASGRELDSSGNRIFQIIWGICYIIACVIIYKKRIKLKSLFPNKVLFWIGIICFFCLLSTLWSADPLLTLRRSIALIGTTLFAISLTLIVSFSELKSILRNYYIIAILGSLFLLLLLPDFAFMIDRTQPDSLRGIFAHKNLLGRIMALGAVLFLSLYLKEKKLVNIIITLGCVILVILSKSAGALVLLIILILLLWIVKTISIDTPVKALISLFVAFIMLILMTVVLAYYEIFLQALGRDATFTGRTILWYYAWIAINNKFLLGYGYSSFWAGDGSPSEYILNRVYWDAPHSHNGFLDLWLDLGLVGIIIILIIFSYLIYRNYKIYMISKSTQAEWSLIILFFLIFASIPESVLLKQNDIHWIIFIIAIALPAMSTLKHTKFSLKVYEKNVNLQ